MSKIDSVINKMILRENLKEEWVDERDKVMKFAKKVFGSEIKEFKEKEGNIEIRFVKNPSGVYLSDLGEFAKKYQNSLLVASGNQLIVSVSGYKLK